MKNTKIRNILKIILTAFIVITVLYLLQRLVFPKYSVGIQEGHMMREYYDDKTKHNLIVIGDSEMYENISPVTLWEKYGISTYIRGSAQQLIWQSYYVLEDTLRYETPEVVLMNVSSMAYSEPQKETYNRMTLEGLRWSKSKAEAIKASMTEEESFIEYVFPILRYHSRWSELSADDIKYIFHEDNVSLNGYMMQLGVKPAGEIPEGRPLADYTFADIDYEYLDRITGLCEEKGIELVLIKSPSLYPYWYEEWDEQMREYADAHGIEYINCVNNQDTDIDFDTDTCDGGLHLNVWGAEKLADYLGGVLKTRTGISDLRDDKELVEIWNKKKEEYELKKYSG